MSDQIRKEWTDNPFQCYRNLWVRNLNRKPGMRGGWLMVVYTQAAHTMKNFKNVPSLYIWYCLLFWSYLSRVVCISLSYMRRMENNLLLLRYIFLFQRYFLLFKFKNSLLNLWKFQRLFRAGYGTVCTPAKYLLFLVFIVTESVNRDMPLQILVPPTRLGAEERLGVVGSHSGDSGGAGE